MATMVLRGIWAGYEVSVNWIDGVVTTAPEPSLVDVINLMAEYEMGNHIGVPAGPSSDTNYFDNPWVFQALMEKYWDRTLGYSLSEDMVDLKAESVGGEPDPNLNAPIMEDE